jgi:hypothetical protein
MRFSIDVGSELELKLYQASAALPKRSRKPGDGNGPWRGPERGRWHSTAWCRATAQYGSPAGADETAWDELSGRISARSRRRANSRVNRLVDASRNAAHVLS